MEITLTDADLARLEELAGKATPGPWKETTDPSHFYTISTVLGGVEAQRSGVWQQMIIQVGGWADVPEQEANTRYIAAACNAALALVAEVRRLRAERAQLCAAEDDLK